MQLCRPSGSHLKIAKYGYKCDVKTPFTYMNHKYHAKESGFTLNYVKSGYGMMGMEALAGTDGYKRAKFVGEFSPTPSNLYIWRNVSPVAFSPLPNYRLYSSFSGAGGDKSGQTQEVSAVSGAGEPDVSESGVGGSDWTDMVKDAWQSTVDAMICTGERVKETSTDLTPYVNKLIDAHPYLGQVVVPVGCTLTATVLAWVLMPRLLRRFQRYSTQGPAELLSAITLQRPIPYEKSCWGALEDPARYLITFMAFSHISVTVAPTAFASLYVVTAWRGAIVVSFVWFLHRWKKNAFTRALAVRNIAGVERQELQTLDKISSIGLSVLGLTALAEACGVAVQSVMVVGLIGEAATAFAARDILWNILSGLSVQISQPFSVGDTIKVGSIEGQIVKMGLITTSLLSAEKFPTIVPNSLLSNQVIINKSRWHAMVTKIHLQTDDLSKIPHISEDIKSMLRSYSKVFLEEEPPYCFLSRIERSYAELTLGCNLKQMSKDEFYSTEQDILLQSVQIIKQHGATLGSTLEDMIKISTSP